MGRNGEGWRGMGRGEEGCGRMERDGKKSISDPKGWREQFEVKTHYLLSNSVYTVKGNIWHLFVNVLVLTQRWSLYLCVFKKPWISRKNFFDELLRLRYSQLGQK